MLLTGMATEMDFVVWLCLAKLRIKLRHYSFGIVPKFYSYLRQSYGMLGWVVSSFG